MKVEPGRIRLLTSEDGRDYEDDDLISYHYLLSDERKIPTAGAYLGLDRLMGALNSDLSFHGYLSRFPTPTGEHCTDLILLAKFSPHPVEPYWVFRHENGLLITIYIHENGLRETKPHLRCLGTFAELHANELLPPKVKDAIKEQCIEDFVALVERFTLC